MFIKQFIYFFFNSSKDVPEFSLFFIIKLFFKNRIIFIIHSYKIFLIIFYISNLKKEEMNMDTKKEATRKKSLGELGNYLQLNISG